MYCSIYQDMQKVEQWKPPQMYEGLLDKVM
jgi:hypothetical protein